MEGLVEKIKRNPDVAWRTFEDQGVILDLDSGKVLGLNGVAARIWELLEQPTTADEIAKEISSEYSITLGEAGRDAGEFLDSLREKGLLVSAEP